MESTSPTASASAAGRSRPSRSAWCCSGLRTPRTYTGATPVRIMERHTLPPVDRGRLRRARQVTGVGEACNRNELAVRRTVPFGLLCQSLLPSGRRLRSTRTACTERRRLAPWLDRRSRALEGSQRPGRATESIASFITSTHFRSTGAYTPHHRHHVFSKGALPVGVAWPPITREANTLLISIVQLNIMESQVGIEPTTYALPRRWTWRALTRIRKGHRSALRPTHFRSLLQRDSGLEVGFASDPLPGKGADPRQDPTVSS
jgi:hypothetical protein